MTGAVLREVLSHLETDDQVEDPAEVKRRAKVDLLEAVTRDGECVERGVAINPIDVLNAQVFEYRQPRAHPAAHVEHSPHRAQKLQYDRYNHHGRSG